MTQPMHSIVRLAEISEQILEREGLIQERRRPREMPQGPYGREPSAPPMPKDYKDLSRDQAELVLAAMAAWEAKPYNRRPPSWWSDGRESATQAAITALGGKLPNFLKRKGLSGKNKLEKQLTRAGRMVGGRAESEETPRMDQKALTNLLTGRSRSTYASIAEADASKDGVTYGHNRYSQTMDPATKDKVLQARVQEIEEFARDRSLPLPVVFGVAEATLRTGRVPELGMYGLAGDEAMAVKHFMASAIMNIAGMEAVDWDGTPIQMEARDPKEVVWQFRKTGSAKKFYDMLKSMESRHDWSAQLSRDGLKVMVSGIGSSSGVAGIKNFVELDNLASAHHGKKLKSRTEAVDLAGGDRPRAGSTGELDERDTRAMAAYKAGARSKRVERGKQGFVSGQDTRDRGAKKVKAPNLDAPARTSKQARSRNKARWQEAPGTGNSAYRRAFRGGTESKPNRSDVEKAVGQSKKARKASAYKEDEAMTEAQRALAAYRGSDLSEGALRQPRKVRAPNVNPQSKKVGHSRAMTREHPGAGYETGGRAAGRRGASRHDDPSYAVARSREATRASRYREDDGMTESQRALAAFRGVLPEGSSYTVAERPASRSFGDSPNPEAPADPGEPYVQGNLDAKVATKLNKDTDAVKTTDLTTAQLRRLARERGELGTEGVDPTPEEILQIGADDHRGDQWPKVGRALDSMLSMTGSLRRGGSWGFNGRLGEDNECDSTDESVKGKFQRRMGMDKKKLQRKTGAAAKGGVDRDKKNRARHSRSQAGGGRKFSGGGTSSDYGWERTQKKEPARREAQPRVPGAFPRRKKLASGAQVEHDLAPAARGLGGRFVHYDASGKGVYEFGSEDQARAFADRVGGTAKGNQVTVSEKQTVKKESRFVQFGGRGLARMGQTRATPVQIEGVSQQEAGHIGYGGNFRGGPVGGGGGSESPPSDDEKKPKKKMPVKVNEALGAFRQNQSFLGEGAGQTIFNQLKKMRINGFPLLAYLGAKKISVGNDDFRAWMGGKWKGYVVIEYNRGTDYYDLTFFRIRSYEHITDCKVLGVEVGNLPLVLQRYVEYGEAKGKKGREIRA